MLSGIRCAPSQSSVSHKRVVQSGPAFHTGRRRVKGVSYFRDLVQTFSNELDGEPRECATRWYTFLYINLYKCTNVIPNTVGDRGCRFGSTDAKVFEERS